MATWIPCRTQEVFSGRLFCTFCGAGLSPRFAFLGMVCTPLQLRFEPATDQLDRLRPEPQGALDLGPLRLRAGVRVDGRHAERPAAGAERMAQRQLADQRVDV